MEFLILITGLALGYKVGKYVESTEFKVFPVLTRNMDGEILLFWGHRRWLRRSGKWIND